MTKTIAVSTFHIYADGIEKILVSNGSILVTYRRKPIGILVPYSEAAEAELCVNRATESCDDPR